MSDQKSSTGRVDGPYVSVWDDLTQSGFRAKGTSHGLGCHRLVVLVGRHAAAAGCPVVRLASRVPFSSIARRNILYIVGNNKLPLLVYNQPKIQNKLYMTSTNNVRLETIDILYKFTLTVIYKLSTI